ncbi:hypothetical protein GCM10007424_23760 [Flavobacterium suaedae]|uniref:BIG2 domain-containing protein n=1 Tax=Flavobacterium suaedae TaxID=1767027 RepID=A0ABQ1K3P3_9FLAO|nr:hypothetical protein [Flavobacterium suaedae]GGB82983.1 hypothetical protein GCM10007424_23760 [Flavobacterium suaedae]
MKLERNCWALWFSVLLILFFATSCRTIKNTKQVHETIQDSTWVKKTIKPVDTTITVPAQYARIAVNWDALTETPVINKQGKLTAKVSRQGDTIIAECNQEQLELTIQLQNELLEVYRQKIKNTTKQEVKTITTTKTPWYWWPFIIQGIIAFIGLLIGGITPFIRKKRKQDER